MPKVKAPWTNEEFEILTREQIEEIIRGLDPEEIVKKAYSGYIPGMKAGYAAINLITGKLETESLGQGEQNQGQDALWVAVYKIGPNPLEWSDEDIYTPEEIEQYKKSEAYEEGLSIAEYFDLSPEEYAERELNALLHYFELDWTWIEDQLDHWYEKAGE